MHIYSWFKDGKKQIEFSENRTGSIELDIVKVGYEDENNGVLVININEENIICVTKIIITEIEELIIQLEYLIKIK